MGALDTLGYLFRKQGNYIKSFDIRQQQVELSKKYGRESTLAGALIVYHTESRLKGNFRQAIEAVSEALNIQHKAKDAYSEVDCLSNLAVSQFFIGYIERALSTIEQAILLTHTICSKRMSVLVAMRHSHILIGIGHYKEAYNILENAVLDGMRREINCGDFHIYLINSAHLYLAFNKIENALNRLQKIEEYHKKFVFMDASAMLKDAYAQVYLAQGDLANATAAVNEAIALFQQMHSFRLGEADLTLAAIELAQQQPAAALQHALNAGNIFKPIEYYRYGETVLMAARAHFALKNYTAVQAQLKAAAAEFKRLQQPHHLAEVKLLYGQYLLAAGRHAQALQMLTNAKNTFAKLGLKRLENEAQRLINSP